MLTTRSSALCAAESGLQLALSMNFQGADPYDGLSAPMARFLMTKRPRQAWLQLIKRSGTPIRKVLSIPPVRMAKTLALFSMAAAELGNTDLAGSLVDDLLKQGGPWGYEFDVQTRWAFYKSGTPNVVATTFALRAIDQLGRIDEVPPDVASWLTSLYQDGGYFAYTSASPTLIHNGSLLAAESLARLQRGQHMIESAISTTLRCQRKDGGWAYGEGQGLEWEDSFHTIYVVDSLTELQKRGYVVDDAPAKALAHWKDSFFTPDGQPTYFAHDKRPSNELHNLSTVLGAIADYSEVADVGRFADTVASKLLKAQGPDGAFLHGHDVNAKRASDAKNYNRAPQNSIYAHHLDTLGECDKGHLDDEE